MNTAPQTTARTTAIQMLILKHNGKATDETINVLLKSFPANLGKFTKQELIKMANMTLEELNNELAITNK